MRSLKSLDYKILFELMKNARMTDRKIAKKLGVSQPTVTRRRTNLEREVIDGYTAIPKWDKLGYGILAVILSKADHKFATEKEGKDARDRARKWLAKQSNMIMGSRCRGMGMNTIMICLHKDYADFDEFMNTYRRELGDLFQDVHAIIVNLSGKAVYRPFHLKYLAEAEETSED